MHEFIDISLLVNEFNSLLLKLELFGASAVCVLSASFHVHVCSSAASELLTHDLRLSR